MIIAAYRVGVGSIPTKLQSPASRPAGVWHWPRSSHSEMPVSISRNNDPRILFIPTTWHKFAHALEINDLYEGSPLEDRLWAAMKRQQITAEREFFIQIGQQDFALDFAIFCEKADIDVETDGDTYHANPVKGTAGNIRSNALEAAGWSVLRFNTPQINQELESYTLPKIVETINIQGGPAAYQQDEASSLSAVCPNALATPAAYPAALLHGRQHPAPVRQRQQRRRAATPSRHPFR